MCSMPAATTAPKYSYRTPTTRSVYPSQSRSATASANPKRSPASAAGVIVTAGLVLWGVSTTVSLMLGVGDGGSGPDDLGAFLDGLG